jgi:peptide/nickel transport system substrate-binding protein
MQKFVRALTAALLAASFLTQTACQNTRIGGEAGRHRWSIPHVLRIADISDPDTLNEYLSTMDLVYFLSSLMYSYLVVADDHGQLQGDLATAVPSLRNGGISGDGRTYVYHLRPGVRWQDGAALTSADVKFSWEAVVNPNNNALHREGYDEVSSIDTPDAQTVIVHLKRRYPPFVSKFFAPVQEGGKPVLPRHLLAQYRSINQVPFNGAPIGSGPFKFEKWERGRRIVLVRNPYYYRGLPKLRRVELEIIPSDQTILNEVSLHHVDLVDTPAVTQYRQYRALPDVVTTTAPWNAQELLVINNAKPGLDDVRVRRAISMAIDYASIIHKLTYDTAERARDYVPPTAIGYAANAPFRYDPAQANALLDSAGYRRGPDGIRAKGGVRLDYTLASISGSVALRLMAVQLQQYYRAAGIGLNIRDYAYNDMFTPEGPMYSGKYDFAIYGVTLSWDADLSFYVGCKAFYPSGENIYRYCNPQVDRYEAAALSTDDPQQRAAAYHKADALLWQTVPYIPIYERRRIIVRSPDLSGFTTNPSATPWYNAWQWDI